MVLSVACAGDIVRILPCCKVKLWSQNTVVLAWFPDKVNFTMYERSTTLVITPLLV